MSVFSTMRFFLAGKLQSFMAQPLQALQASPRAASGSGRPRGGAKHGPLYAGLSRLKQVIRAQGERLSSLFHDFDEAAALASVSRLKHDFLIPTHTMIVEGGKAEIQRICAAHGMKKIREGSFGKTLLKAPEGGQKGVLQVFAAAQACFRRGNVLACHPNFVRAIPQVGPQAPGGKPLWNHKNDGSPGVPGADVAAPAAWTLSRGLPEIRVAVLDEGVDTVHAALKAAVVAERDFVDGSPTARPDGNDAHGTACAGIILSRSTQVPGLAPNVSLVAVRIAKGDGSDGWVFDDFNTADAIDWSWQTAKADVLSNSWGGGPPVDAITNAFVRARTKGRNGKGAVVAIASGNDNGPVSFPGTLPNVLCVGASSPWDERKSPTSLDGENWWGSNFGPALTLVAPGVKIATTDITGAAGYASGNFVDNFNGTSSATPHVAAAAALILSVMPGLSEQKVREVIAASADRLPTYNKKGAWNKEVGWGRLNLFSALRLARR